MQFMKAARFLFRTLIVCLLSSPLIISRSDLAGIDSVEKAFGLVLKLSAWELIPALLIALLVFEYLWRLLVGLVAPEYLDYGVDSFDYLDSNLKLPGRRNVPPSRKKAHSRYIVRQIQEISGPLQ